MFLTALVQSICLHQYFHRVMKTGMHLRSGIINIVYSKSLVLSNSGMMYMTLNDGPGHRAVRFILVLTPSFLSSHSPTILHHGRDC